MSITLGSWAIEVGLVSQTSAEIVRVYQVHGGEIARADEVTSNKVVADGVILAADFERPCMITTADCLPLVLVSDSAACALHVSRKSVLAGLLENVPNFLDVATITGVYGGPHICAQHFVFEYVGHDVQAFQEQYPFAGEEDHDGIHLSLVKVVERQLEEWGLASEIITWDGRCTFESAELPSYRRALRNNELPLPDHVATIVKALPI